MRQPREIVRFIDRYSRHALERPDMYAASPEALEDSLRLLDALRRFILDETVRRESFWESPYHEFLREKGFGGFTFSLRTFSSARNNSQRQTARTWRDFQLLADFWKEFLQWRAARERTGRADPPSPIVGAGGKRKGAKSKTPRRHRGAGSTGGGGAGATGSPRRR
jgi:hypothetical protein